MAVGAVLVGGGLWLASGLHDRPRRSAAPAPKRADARASVLVIVVRSSADLEALRAVVPAERILARSPGAFALADGRIFATGVEAAGRPLSELGWAERRIEIVDSALVRAGAAAPGDAPRDPALALAQKGSLSPGEALALMNHMLNQP
jgi:hypothetical protein